MLISPPVPGEVTETAECAESTGSNSHSSSLHVSDGQLLRRYVNQRDEAAFSQLVTRFGPLVYAVALRTLRDQHAAEDVFQATFLVLSRDAHKIRSPESVGAWLHGAAMRIAKRALARRRREASSEDVASLADQSSLLDEICERFEQQLVDEELRRLPLRYRAPLILHILEGKSCEETATALGTTVGAVRGRLQRGKRELKLRLIKRGVETSSVVAALALWQSVAEAAVQPPLVSAAVQGGVAIAQGTTMPTVCSPEAVHLAAKETAMFTMGNVLVTSAALVITAAAGWFAHAATAGNARAQSNTSLPSPFTLDQETVSSGPLEAEAAALRTDNDIALVEAADSEAEGDGKPQLILKYGDGKANDKRSLAGTGEAIRFTLPDSSQKLRNLRVHSSRYGYPKPPDEDAEITIMSEDGTDIVHTEFVPYSTFKRGEERWTTIRFEELVEVPETFWVILNFNAEPTKGVYVSFDTSTGGKHSRTGLPGGTLSKVNFGGDWMIQAVLTKPE